MSRKRHFGWARRFARKLLALERRNAVQRRSIRRPSQRNAGLPIRLSRWPAHPVEVVQVRHLHDGLA